jgi:hypothetical protein
MVVHYKLFIHHYKDMFLKELYNAISKVPPTQVKK